MYSRSYKQIASPNWSRNKFRVLHRISDSSHSRRPGPYAKRFEARTWIQIQTNAMLFMASNELSSWNQIRFQDKPNKNGKMAFKSIRPQIYLHCVAVPTGTGNVIEIQTNRYDPWRSLAAVGSDDISMLCQRQIADRTDGPNCWRFANGSACIRLGRAIISGRYASCPPLLVLCVCVSVSV